MLTTSSTFSRYFSTYFSLSLHYSPNFPNLFLYYLPMCLILLMMSLLDISVFSSRTKLKSTEIFLLVFLLPFTIFNSDKILFMFYTKYSLNFLFSFTIFYYFNSCLSNCYFTSPLTFPSPDHVLIEATLLSFSLIYLRNSSTLPYNYLTFISYFSFIIPPSFTSLPNLYIYFYCLRILSFSSLFSLLVILFAYSIYPILLL